MHKTLYLSGLYSGPSPSAGLGVARSLRQAFPTLRLVGVDYWVGSSGLHDPVLDDVWLCPSWDHLDPALHARSILEKLDAGAYYLSTLDVEIAWLVKHIGDHPRFLGPSASALRAVSKGADSIGAELPFRVPETLALPAPDDVVYDMARRSSFRVWIKGPYHDAIFASGHRQIEAARASLAAKWGTESLTMQSHVRGLEESICLSANRGRIADIVYMRKRVTTPEGKTWAGRVTSLPKELEGPLDAIAEKLDWTGGAELELIRDADGELHFNEWNPRFPAWIHGATLTGRNLPAALLAETMGVPYGTTRTVAASQEFTRVVVEIPARPELPLPLPTEPHHGQVVASGKYGAALPALVRVLDDADEIVHVAPALPDDLASDLARGFDPGRGTPQRVLLGSEMDRAFARIADLHRIEVDGVRLRSGYSIKTCPDPQFVDRARQSGMYAECISQLEVRRALETGFLPGQIILNGPGKWWPETAPVKGLRAVFADSLEELKRIGDANLEAKLVGVRLRIPDFGSRFGIELDSPQAFDLVTDAIMQLPVGPAFGVHIHLSSTMIGAGHWLDAAECAVAWASSIERITGRSVTVLDLGGGYHPDDLARIPWAELMQFARNELPSLREVWIEPGRALSQSTMALVTRVLDVRTRGGETNEVVVDACIAELPLASVYPHRMGRLGDDGHVAPLARGRTRVLGRICMEDDVLAAGVALDAPIELGDRLVFCDAGAYERSMSYDFGRGGYSAT